MSDEGMKLLEFSRLLGKLKSLQRTGWVRKGIANPESVASHMHRTAVFAFLLDKKVVDVGRCIKMALIHDIGESIVGDITPHCGVSDTSKYTQEKEALQSLTQLIPKEVGEELLSLWEEYEAQETPEAKAVKDLDKFDMVAQAFEL